MPHIRKWLHAHPLSETDAYTQESVHYYINKLNNEGLSPTQQAHMRSALKWFFHRYLSMFAIDVAPFKLKKKLDPEHEKTWWKKEQIIDMLRVPPNPKFQQRAMRLAGMLMYEMGLRRQDL